MSRHNDIIDSFGFVGEQGEHPNLYPCNECGAVVVGVEGMYRHYEWHYQLRYADGHPDDD